MKVFISGPMKNKPNGNKEEFFKAEYKLKGLGYSVFNPAWFRYGVVTEFTPDDMHMIDFSALSRCDAIYMLKGWQYSKGAKAEYDHAKILCKAILREGDPITDPLICDKYDWESFKNKLPDRLDITSKHPRVMKPIDDCFSIYDYIGPNTPEFDKEFAYDEAVKNRTNYQLETIKGNIRAKYAELKNITENLDISIGNESDRINSLECEVEAIKESIGTDHLQEQLEKDFADVYEEFQNTKDKANDIEYGYIDWSSKMSSAIEEMEKVKDTVKGLNSIVGELGNRFDRSGIEGISVKAMNQKLIDLGRELDVYIDDYKEAYKQLNNADNALERRIKAIEKRLSIKPFYEPTEDEKDD